MTIVHDLQECRCFAPAIPFGEQLAAVHVPFDDLLGNAAQERRVRQIAQTGGLSLVIGDTGEGKSGLVSYALSIAHDFLAVTVPVSVPYPAGALPSQIPAMVLNGFARVLATINETAAIEAELAAAGQRPRRRLSGTLTWKGMQLNVGDLLRDRPRTAREQRDAISQATVALREYGLAPVLVLDDTDKWSTGADRLLAGREFFDQCLEALVELELPVVANAHPRYFDETRPPTHFDAVVELPRLQQDGIARILARRVEAATDHQTTAADVFTHEALTTVADVYSQDPSVTIRRIIQIANEALLEADEAGLEHITIGAVQNALAAR